MPNDLPHIEILDEEMAAVLRAKTGAERLKIANDMFVSVRRMIASHLAAEHPDWDEESIQRETSRRISHGASEGMAQKSGKRPVLSDHQRKGKTFIPPFTAQLGPLNEVSWIRRILPEILWIALLHQISGLSRGVQLAQGLARQAMETNRKLGMFGSTSSFSLLSSDDFQNLRQRLVADGSLFDLQRCLSPLVSLYPKCPLLHLFTVTPYDTSYLPTIKTAVEKLYDRNSCDSVFAQSTFIYLALDAGILHVKKGLALADFPLVQDYPNTERSKQVAASVRAAISIFFGEPQYDPALRWPGYFWNRGLELEGCFFSSGERLDRESHSNS